jgi:2-polyprenyl-3-methyl-5-hydroxy-6-metoxy-1,4-benzoquinol methylase
MSLTEQRSRDELARFDFGENWRRFVQDLDDEQVEAARHSLVTWLGEDSVEGSSFLDIGSGSGIFSLAAVLLDAERVHSFDDDAASVATTSDLKRRFAPTANWTVEKASALDVGYMESLGRWDIVYAWGVLHHTGAMWTALDLTCARVRPGGLLFVSVYNDQGWRSRVWRGLKRVHNRLPSSVQAPYTLALTLPMELRSLVVSIARLRPWEYLRLWRRQGYGERGMRRWHDLRDWVGGYPFEVATPEQVFEFCRSRGFTLRRLRTCGGSHGCNQLVFDLPVDAGRS